MFDQYLHRYPVPNTWRPTPENWTATVRSFPNTAKKEKTQIKVGGVRGRKVGSLQVSARHTADRTSSSLHGRRWQCSKFVQIIGLCGNGALKFSTADTRSGHSNPVNIVVTKFPLLTSQ
jgi:hypothetical protein